MNNDENQKMVTFSRVIRKGEMEKYSRLIELKFELSEFSATGSKSRNIDLIKDIVLGIHFLAESWIEYLIGTYYLGNANREKKKFKNFCEIVLVRITFFQKLLIAKQVSVIEKKDFRILEDINTIRNAFVHNYSIRSAKFIYKGKKITAWGHIEVLIKDFELFLSRITGQKVNLLPKKSRYDSIFEKEK